MLNREDRDAIEGLFRRLRDVERGAEPRDPEAEALIRDEIAHQPSAPYYMAQTVLVQEHALSVAERRIRDLEDELERARIAQPPAAQPGPWERTNRFDSRGGGFLAGAAQTALGVTGGVLLGNALAGMFGAGAATAAESAPLPEPPVDTGVEDVGGDDGDFGDPGGFDFGGDF